MKLKPRIKVVLAEKNVKQVEIAKYYLEQTGEEVTPKRVKSISNTISRYARGEFNPSVLMLFYYMEKYLDCRLSDLFTPENMFRSGKTTLKRRCLNAWKAEKNCPVKQSCLLMCRGQ